jgi:putative SOS response-associated peptidase YedK
MCGRYVVAYDPQTLVAGFSLTRVVPFPRRWNVTPQSAVPVVHETKQGERVGDLMRWGLVPHWAKEASIGHRPFAPVSAMTATAASGPRKDPPLAALPFKG